MKPYCLGAIPRDLACAAAVVGLLCLAAPTEAYIDAAENHTLPRLLIQMSPVVVLKVERVDLAKSAVAFQVTDRIKGKEVDEGIKGTVKHALL